MERSAPPALSVPVALLSLFSFPSPSLVLIGHFPWRLFVGRPPPPPTLFRGISAPCSVRRGAARYRARFAHAVPNPAPLETNHHYESRRFLPRRFPPGRQTEKFESSERNGFSRPARRPADSLSRVCARAGARHRRDVGENCNFP